MAKQSSPVTRFESVEAILTDPSPLWRIEYDKERERMLETQRNLLVEVMKAKDAAIAKKEKTFSLQQSVSEELARFMDDVYVLLEEEEKEVEAAAAKEEARSVEAKWTSKQAKEAKKQLDDADEANKPRLQQLYNEVVERDKTAEESIRTSTEDAEMRKLQDFLRVAQGKKPLNEDASEQNLTQPA